MNVGKLLPSKVVPTFVSKQYLVVELGDETREKLTSLFTSAYVFFRESDAHKQRCGFAQDIGYRPLGREYSKSPDHPDQIESFSVAARLPIPPSDLPIASARLLNSSMIDVFDLFERIAEEIATRLATELSSKSDGNRLRGGLTLWSRLQVNYSKPASTRVPFINETHEDLNFLTVSCATAPGLQVRSINAKFTPVPTNAGRLVIFPGEIAWLLSGGEIHPVYHRVIPDPSIEERLALLLFADLDPSLCAPWVETEVNRNIDIGNRSVTNVRRFGLKDFDKNDVTN